MEAQGMVHALEEIRRLLKPDGCLIDIHPIPEAPQFKVYQGSKLLFAEPHPGYDYEADLRYAEEALEEVVRRGWFLLEGQGEFDLITYATSAAEMRDFWAEVNAYEDSPIDDAVTAQKEEVYAQADEIRRAAGGGAEIAYHEKARITRLKPETAY
jgi:SAM-dependent methyltransferase